MLTQTQICTISFLKSNFIVFFKEILLYKYKKKEAKNRYYIFWTFKAKDLFEIWKMEELEYLPYLFCFLSFFILGKLYSTNMHLSTYSGLKCGVRRAKLRHSTVGYLGVLFSL